MLACHAVASCEGGCSSSEANVQRATRLRKATARQALNSDKSRAGVQRPSKKKVGAALVILEKILAKE